MYKEKKIDIVTLSLCLDKLQDLSKQLYDELPVDKVELSFELDKIIDDLKNNFVDVKAANISFDKVKVVYLDPELMGMLNLQTGIDEFETDNWCDKSEFERVPSINEFITEEQKEAIRNGEIDYIAFRIDR